jgi:hypothetical protein
VKLTAAPCPHSHEAVAAAAAVGRTQA